MAPTVLITGASSGIGLELAKIFARENNNLILVARNEDKLNELKGELTETREIHVEVFSHDLTAPASPQKLFDQIQHNNLSVDVLVNNAGYGDYGDFASSDWVKQQGMVSLHVMTLTHLTHLLLPGMLQRGRGKILNVASTAAFQPGPMMAVYFASKAYVLSFSEALSAETEGTGVSVTVLCPGPTQTNFVEVANMDNIAAVANVSADAFPTADAVAEYGYTALKKGQVVAIHGVLNRLLILSNRFVPRSLIRKGLKQFMAPKEDV